jgi:hypothetical protein
VGVQLDERLPFLRRHPARSKLITSPEPLFLVTLKVLSKLLDSQA